MPKKGSKKGGKKGKGKAKEEYNRPHHPQDPELVAPRVFLTVKLANPVNDLMQFKMELPNIARIEAVHKEISKLHQGAISSILLCRDRFNPEEVLDPQKSLEQCGIFEGEVKCFYDYKPVTGPLLK